MMSPLPFLSQIYSHVQEEKQQQVKSGFQFQSKSTSFSVKKVPRSGGNAIKGPITRRPDNKRSSSLFCEHCKRSGHTVVVLYLYHKCTE